MKGILNNYVIRIKNRQVQIQGFPGRNANHRGGANLIFGQHFLKNLWK